MYFMNDDDIKEFLLSIGKNHRNRKLKGTSEYHQYLLKKYDGISEDLSEIVYLFLNNLEKPKCVVCNSYVKWHGKGKYKETCSHECRAKTIDYELRNEKGDYQRRRLDSNRG